MNTFVESRLAREKYEELAESQLKEYDDGFEKFKSRVAEASQDVKQQWEEECRMLEVKKTILMNKLVDFKNSGENAWEELADGLEKATTDLKVSFERAAKSFE